MKRVFVICPVRSVTKEVRDKIAAYVASLEAQGYIVHWPQRDTDQNDPVGDQICNQNFKGIVVADEIHVWYDESSTGSYFDFGGVFMMVEVLSQEKKVVLINDDEAVATPHKSFINVLRYLVDKTKNY